MHPIKADLVEARKQERWDGSTCVLAQCVRRCNPNMSQIEIADAIEALVSEEPNSRRIMNTFDHYFDGVDNPVTNHAALDVLLAELPEV